MRWDTRGGGGEIAAIAGIAAIARHRRDRKGKTLPLIHADDTDQKDHSRGRLCDTILVDPTPISPKMLQIYAKLGWLGMTSVKPFGILVEARGRGRQEIG
jgi:hypothetical protein